MTGILDNQLSFIISSSTSFPVISGIKRSKRTKSKTLSFYIKSSIAYFPFSTGVDSKLLKFKMSIKDNL